MFCIKCGREMKEEDIFCPSCGAKNPTHQNTEPSYINQQGNSISREEMENLNRSMQSIQNGVKNLNLYVRIAIPIITCILEIICRSNFVKEWVGMAKGDWTRTTHYYISSGGAFLMILLLIVSVIISIWLAHRNKNTQPSRGFIRELFSLPSILTIISIILTFMLIFGMSEVK